jgi:hypothetical protein
MSALLYNDFGKLVPAMPRRLHDGRLEAELPHLSSPGTTYVVDSPLSSFVISDLALVDAVKLLGTYTAGRFDSYMLAGPSKATCRQHVMSALVGCKLPQSKCGVTALRAELWKRAGVDEQGNCIAECDSLFEDFCRQIIN